MFILRTLGSLHLQSPDEQRYRGVHNLLLLCYLSLEGRKRRKDVAALLWPDKETPLNNLAVALSLLRRKLGGCTWIIDSPDADPLLPSLEVKRDWLITPASYVAGESQAPCALLSDVALCEYACAQGDIVLLDDVYQGMFLEGVEHKLPQLSPAFKEWLEDIRSRLANQVLETVVKALPSPHCQPQANKPRNNGPNNNNAQRQENQRQQHAYNLLSRLLNEYSSDILAPALLAEAHVHGDAPQRQRFQHSLLQLLEQRSQANPHYLPMLHALALQPQLEWNIACHAQQVPSALRFPLKQQLHDDEWLEEGAPQRLRGRSFFLELLDDKPHILYPTVHRLLEATPLSAITLSDIVTLAQRYYQGLGDFGDLPWDKLGEAYSHHLQQLSRNERFAEVESISRSWEQVRQQRREPRDPRMHFYYVYSLERQGRYPEALELLQQDPQASRRHCALQAVLLLRTGQLDLAHNQAERLLASLDNSLEDTWVRAELYGLFGKYSYHQGDYAQSLAYYRQAAECWQHVDEPCRYLGALASAAAAHDYHGEFNEADKLYRYIEQESRRWDLPLLLQLRSRLNQLLLWEAYKPQWWQETRQGFRELIVQLEHSQVSHELLGNAYYNFGFHHYQHRDEQPEAERSAALDQAMMYYYKALEQLHHSRDHVALACSKGELGRLYLLQGDRRHGATLVREAVTLLQQAKLTNYLQEYQALLEQYQLDTLPVAQR